MKQNSDFQAKRDLLINLKRKILEKNPDEFYFNMAKTQIKVLKIRKNIINSKHIVYLCIHFQDGVHKLRNPFVEFTEDELKLMKTQDKNYIKFHQQMESKVNFSRYFSFAEYK